MLALIVLVVVQYEVVVVDNLVVMAYPIANQLFGTDGHTLEHSNFESYLVSFDIAASYQQSHNNLPAGQRSEERRQYLRSL